MPDLLVQLSDNLLFLSTDSIPYARIVYNRYAALPLPSASPRDVCLERMWMPSYLTKNGTSGAFLCLKKINK